MRFVALAFLFSLTSWGQLPVARLTSLFPAGAQIGVATTVKADGADLDEPVELRFSNPGITGRLTNGAFHVSAGTNVAPGIYEARVIGRFGASNPRPFVIGALPESTQKLELGSVYNGKANANAAQEFKLKLEAIQMVVFHCEARAIDSKMEPVLTVLDASGREVARARHGGLLEFTPKEAGEYVLKLNDNQFRGGDEFWYRLRALKAPLTQYALPCAIEPGTKSKVLLYPQKSEIEITGASKPEATLLTRGLSAAALDAFEFSGTMLSLAAGKVFLESANNDAATNAMALTVPCDVSGQFYPQRDVDWYEFEAAKGEVLWVEVFSQRLGLNTDPFLLVNGQEGYDIDANVGGNDFNTSTRDVAVRHEAKEGGKVRVMVKDLFGANISDPRRIYRLAIRKETPDFRLIACSPAPPPLNKDSKELSTYGTFLRRGDSIALRVMALRRDGFDGAIDLSVEGLPPGVTAAPARLAAGVNSGYVIISAAEDAGAWTGPVQVVGRSKEIVREARAASLAWNVGDYSNEAAHGLLNQELVLSVSGAELAPLAIRQEKAVDATVGGKANVTLQVLRRHEFNNGLKFKTLIEPAREFEGDGKATNATVEIDLAAMKLGEGSHAIPLYATSPGRYRRVTVAEAAALEAEVKKLRDSLGAMADAPKKEAVNNQIKAIEARLVYRDVSATVYATATINVGPKPVAKAP